MRQVDEDSTGGNEQEEEDYLVDHSSYIYLVDPQGQCVDFYGKGQEIEDITRSVKLHMMNVPSASRISS